MNLATTPKTPRTRAEALAEMQAAKAQLKIELAGQDAESEKDWTAAAQKVVNQLYREFPKLKIYLDKVSDQVTRTGYVMSFFGRRRILYRAFAGSKKYVADAQRRAKNAPVQGVGSEVGVTAAHLVLKHMDDYARTFKLSRSGTDFYQYQRAVHDANYGWSQYHLCIPALMINLWCATYGVTEYYEDTFGVRFNIEPEIEIDVGASGDACYTWDYRISELPILYRKSLEDMVKMSRLGADEVEDTMAIIFDPLVNKKKRNHLLTHYPLLGLHPDTPEGARVQERIFGMLRSIGMDPEV